METTEAIRCCFLVRTNSYSRPTRQCERRGPSVVMFEGKPYCRQHHPDEKKRRREAIDFKYKSEQQHREKLHQDQIVGSVIRQANNEEYQRILSTRHYIDRSNKP